jgi:hypothetical protein
MRVWDVGGEEGAERGEGGCAEKDGAAVVGRLAFGTSRREEGGTYPPAAAPSRLRNVSGIFDQGCSKNLQSIQHQLINPQTSL